MTSEEMTEREVRDYTNRKAREAIVRTGRAAVSPEWWAIIKQWVVAKKEEDQTGEEAIVRARVRGITFRVEAGLPPGIWPDDPLLMALYGPIGLDTLAIPPAWSPA